MQDKIFNIIFEQDEIGWKSMIYELVKSEQMDPWDVDVSVLANKYIEMIKKMKDMDLRISGKVLLAAAVLLKIKSSRLLTEDIGAFDRMVSGEDDESLLSETPAPVIDRSLIGRNLSPRTPQPRKRKVSIYELVDALQRALQVEKRRQLLKPIIEMHIPDKKVDITKIIEALYKKIDIWFQTKQKLLFTDLVPSDKREDKVLTFVPLLHLTNQRRVNMDQIRHLGEIEIRLNDISAQALIDESEETVNKKA